ncbi:hypothetical protein ABPG77_007024 [Micractinium sp. CCAP 211/92]
MADKEEYFDLVDEEDRVIGQELRSVVHRKGLLHRAVYVWVFRPDGRLLIQQRSPDKKIGPSQWDLSVAEHLQPGESFLQGAARGLSEELGISVPTSELAGPLAPTHRRELHARDFHDVELVQSFRLEGYSGEVQLDEAEVAAVEWVALSELRRRAEAQPGQFTQWFLDEVSSLAWFEADGRQGAAAAGQTAAGRMQVGPSQASEQLMTSA